MPRYNALRFLLILILTFGAVSAFGRPKRQKIHRKSSGTTTPCNSIDGTTRDSVPENPNEFTIEDYDPYYHCGLAGFGVVQKIPYRTYASGNSPIDVNFSSVCVRCGICLAIAEKMNQTLLAAHDAMLPDQWLEDDEIHLLFRVVCDEQFRHYALREINGERYIGDSVPGAILVVTTADGVWETNMRKKCQDILDAVGTRNLYKRWQDWYLKSTGDFANFLCRGESSELRDCRSINGDGRQPEICRNIYHAGIKLMAKFGW